MNKNGTEPIVSIEKVVQYAIVVRLWSNHGQKVPHHPRKVPHKQKKALKTNGFQGFDGGDKRDRTADLLNAMLCGWKHNEYSWYNESIKSKINE